MELQRRDFLKTAPLAALATAQLAKAAPLPSDDAAAIRARNKIEPFDYQGVRLGPGMWQRQFQAARDFYLAIPDDDILHGFRVAAGLTAKGRALGGWASRSTGGIFGQWLSGMARIYRATGDGALRKKAAHLMTEWGKTFRPEDGYESRHYPFDKFMCGLVDMHLYAAHPDALPLAERLADWGQANLTRENEPAKGERGKYAGKPGEWYTLAENLFRAYQASGNESFKSLAQVWLYPAYWDKFADSAAPADANGVHAYSHVNTFSSAAMAYAVLGDAKYLTIIKNAYDFLQNEQAYATGGYGPSETIAAGDGGLGRALETRTDSFETVCGSWAGFKLGRYLMQFTGEARYGDWIERLLYNGIGAALPIAAGGKNFYYSDYRVGSGMKVYNWENWTCCSGTYIQCVADYHNLIYFKDAAGLYVNLFVPSEVVWQYAGGEVKLVQETSYPEQETTTIKIETRRPAQFALRFRVPAWSSGVSCRLNGQPAAVDCRPGTWAVVDRTWTSGDRLEIRIPLPLRMQAVDNEHPQRVAIVRGPVTLVSEAAYLDPVFRLPATDEELNEWARPDTEPDTSSRPPVPLLPGAFRLHPPDKSDIRSRLRPFYTIGEAYPYRMYHDRDRLPVRYS